MIYFWNARLAQYLIEVSEKDRPRAGKEIEHENN